MNQAGRLFAVAAVFTAAAFSAAQPAAIHPAPQVPTTAPTPVHPVNAAAPADQESSVTVQQIVARQEDHFAKIRNAQGTAVHSEIRFDEKGQPLPPNIQYIFFAYEGDRSVTLAMPKQAAESYRASQGQVPWTQIISAFHVTGDTVYAIRPPERTGRTTGPTVLAIPFNPAVHENNPLVKFHPRQISDEQMPLRDLARAIPNMAQRPRVYDVVRDGKPLLQIEFTNPSTPGERLTYFIDANRGYLPTEIVHVSNSKPVSVSKITIGHTPDGTWIPAKRERVIYNSAGRPASQQNWHYDYLAINQKLAPKTLSLMYFNLPLTTPVTVAAAAAPVTTATQQQAPGRPLSTPTPRPARSAPAPARYSLP